MATLTIMDPVTRIEGHMKVELDIESNKIIDARCTGTLFRGFEILLKGRDPWDAPVITQRICGVCPISHAEAAVLALDNAANGSVPANARILRNLTSGGQLPPVPHSSLLSSCGPRLRKRPPGLPLGSGMG